MRVIEFTLLLRQKPDKVRDNTRPVKHMQKGKRKGRMGTGMRAQKTGNAAV